MTDRTVGIIGLGIMGGAIARNLVERGWAVVGFDTEPARRSELELAGVTIVDGAGAVASRAHDDHDEPAQRRCRQCRRHGNCRLWPAAAYRHRTQHADHSRQASFQGHSRTCRPHCARLSAQRNRRPGQRFATSSSTRAATAPRSRNALACLPTLPSKAPISAITAMAAG